MMAIDIRDHGIIVEMQLPDGWEQQGYSGGSMSLQALVDFHPKDKPEVTVSLFDSGRGLDPKTSAAFRELLKRPPHVLLPRQMEDITPAIRPFMDTFAFNLLNSRTVDLAGRRVLSLQGRWIDQKIEALAYLIPVEVGTRMSVQEIHCKAPQDEFIRYSAVFKEILGTLKLA